MIFQNISQVILIENDKPFYGETCIHVQGRFNGHLSAMNNGFHVPLHQSSRLNNDATYHAYQKSCPLVGAESQIKI